MVVLFDGLFTYVWFSDDKFYWVLVVSAALSAATVTVMFTAATSDPGILQKNTWRGRPIPPAGYFERMEVQHVEVRLPYCPTCNVLRPSAGQPLRAVRQLCR